jgi:hypothetical protein
MFIKFCLRKPIKCCGLINREKEPDRLSIIWRLLSSDWVAVYSGNILKSRVYSALCSDWLWDTPYPVSSEGSLPALKRPKVWNLPFNLYDISFFTVIKVHGLRFNNVLTLCEAITEVSVGNTASMFRIIGLDPSLLQKNVIIRATAPTFVTLISTIWMSGLNLVKFIFLQVFVDFYGILNWGRNAKLDRAGPAVLYT